MIEPIGARRVDFEAQIYGRTYYRNDQDTQIVPVLSDRELQEWLEAALREARKA
jgi:hypothetical protein